MKKLVLVLIAAVGLTSCSFETSMCPSYGHSKRMTNHGAKAQAKYARHGKRRI